nr:immunoglobulin light chain junction region [Macaca mulatta]MOW06177.1 immunoglobulin light chain junction region [Macaca mulatta]MOX16894.1 immunoglobulin light chain junction region [Macaca mulatta]MOX41767.1 immunoglobulin light chain junction region [Macaca mulatta]MOX42148.1 immunoglobulin light chain junction region [Macaca mulatta]
DYYCLIWHNNAYWVF